MWTQKDQLNKYFETDTILTIFYYPWIVLDLNSQYPLKYLYLRVVIINHVSQYSERLFTNQGWAYRSVWCLILAMGEIEVEVISTDTIKPSSPTPAHLRHFQLSFLDQVLSPIFIPIILFYPMDGDVKVDTIERSIWLKKTLSMTLVQFYTLAGRVKDNLFIDCTDQGVPYFEAQVKCQLSEFICNPDPMQLSKFVPHALDDIVDIVLAIQVNIFKCGGIAIGVCISHKVADASSVWSVHNLDWPTSSLP